jgi:hypothetical protein
VISYNCEVNKTVEKHGEIHVVHGALACAMSELKQGLSLETSSLELESFRKSNPNDVLPEIVDLLIGSGASVELAIYIVDFESVRSPEACELLFSAVTTQQHIKSFTSGALAGFTKCIDDETAVRICKYMLSRPSGNDLIYRQPESDAQ